MTVAQGTPFQVCWVVDDIDRAEDTLRRSCGVDRWMRIPDVHFGPDTTTYRGAPADFIAHVSIGYAGDQQIELIAPVSGDSLYSEHLATKGRGLHHLAWLTDDLGAACAEAAAAGLSVDQQGELAGMSFAYVADMLPGSGTYVELMQLDDGMRALFDSLLPPGARNPWGLRPQP